MQQEQYGDIQQSPAGHGPQHSMLDKAKAYIPVLGSSTSFDPAAEARAGQEDRLFQDVAQEDTAFQPESTQHEGFMDKARAYMPTMGAPGTTAAGVDVSVTAALVHFVMMGML